MNSQIRGIVLKSMPFNENDVLLTMLTAESGRLTCLVKRARNTKKGKLFTEQFSLSTFSLFRNKGNLWLCDGADVEETFYDIRRDIKLLAIGQYFLETAALLPENYEEAEPFMKLLLNSVALIAKPEYAEKVTPEIVKLVYETEYLKLSGFLPRFDKCIFCDNPPTIWNFDAGAVCSECSGKASGEKYPMSTAGLSAIKYITEKTGFAKFAFKMSPEALERLGLIMEKYMEYKLETKFKSLDFYRLNNGLLQNT